MNFEETRFKTFENWPPNAPVDKATIARAGFYYLGVNCQVECYNCKLIITDWDYGDKVMSRHKQLSPSCPFVINPLNCDNVPISDTTAYIRKFSRPDLGCKLSTDMPKYRVLSARIESFINRSLSGLVNVIKLADAGYFYSAECNKIQCAFCGIFLLTYDDEDPLVTHCRSSPNCPFLTTLLVGNSSESSDRTVIIRPDHITFEIEYGLKFKEMNQVGIVRHRVPKYQDYVTKEARMESYNACRFTFPVQINDLSAAGFFFTGVDDQVRCYHCDGCLHMWSSGNDPWIEHARHFPDCDFIMLMKGPAFINRSRRHKSSMPRPVKKRRPVRNTRSMVDIVRSLYIPGVGGGDNQPNNHIHNHYSRRVSEIEIQRAWESSLVKDALQCGINERLVRRAIKERLSIFGRMFDTMDQIIEHSLRSGNSNRTVQNGTQVPNMNSNLEDGDVFDCLSCTYDELPDCYFSWRLRHRFGSRYYHHRREMLLQSRTLIIPSFYNRIPIKRQFSEPDPFARIPSNPDSQRFSVFNHNIRPVCDQNNGMIPNDFTHGSGYRGSRVMINSLSTTGNRRSQLSALSMDGAIRMTHFHYDPEEDDIMDDDIMNDDIMDDSGQESRSNEVDTHDSIELAEGDEDLTNAFLSMPDVSVLQSSTSSSSSSFIVQQSLNNVIELEMDEDSLLQFVTDNENDNWNAAIDIDDAAEIEVETTGDNNIALLRANYSEEEVADHQDDDADADTVGIIGGDGDGNGNVVINARVAAALAAVGIDIVARDDDDDEDEDEDDEDDFEDHDEDAPNLYEPTSETEDSLGDLPMECSPPADPPLPGGSGTTSDSLQQIVETGDDADIGGDNSDTHPIENSDNDVESARKLREEIRQLKEGRLCKICMDREINILFLSCGHLVTCSRCAINVPSCPVCRRTIVGTVRTFLP